MGGPIFTDRIHDADFIKALMENVTSEKGRTPRYPLYYTIDKLCYVLKLEMIPTLKMRSAILHEGSLKSQLANSQEK
jgi:tRNA (guanine26-N2/guanine27-N2)-dimethyltransferase